MESAHRQTIDPYYKQGDVFQRDEAYYSQMLTGTRRIANQLTGSARESSLQRSRSNQGQSRMSPNPLRQTESIMRVSSRVNPTTSNALNYNSSNQFSFGSVQPGYVSANVLASPDYKQAFEANQSLRVELQALVNGSNDFGNSQNALKLQHYSLTREETATIRDQEAEIGRLEQRARENEGRIAFLKKSGEELGTHMRNIQEVDREIYRTLEGAENRERVLLERAASGLARGESREEVGRVLQQLLTV